MIKLKYYHMENSKFSINLRAVNYVDDIEDEIVLDFAFSEAEFESLIAQLMDILIKVRKENADSTRLRNDVSNNTVELIDGGILELWNEAHAR